MKYKKQKQELETPPTTYKVAVHKPLRIGSMFMRYEHITTKPSYQTHWYDCTNGEWARNE